MNRRSPFSTNTAIRCLLTDTGKASFRELLNKNYGYGYDPTEVASDFRMDVTVVRKILDALNPNNRANQACQSKSFQDLFKGLFEQIKKIYPDWKLAGNVTYQSLELLLNDENPTIPNEYWEYAPPKSEIDRIKSVNRIANWLCELDYADQQSRFKDLISTVPSQAMSFSLVASEPKLHQWLIYRLIRLIKDCDMETAKVINIKSPVSTTKIVSPDSQWNVSDICSQIARELEIEYHNDVQIFKDLATLNKTCPILIKVHDLNRKADKHILIDRFWYQLIKYFPNYSQPLPNKIPRTIVFLLENSIDDGNYGAESPLCPYLLSSLEIKKDDVARWAKNETGVAKELQRKYGTIDCWLKTEVCQWKWWKEPNSQTDLYQMINSICHSFRADYTLDEIREKW